jgi:hypothetical protein
MDFEHDAHKDAYEKVGKYLKESFGSEGFHAVEDAPLYIGGEGSAMIQVVVYPWGSDDATVSVRSWCVMDMGEMPPECMKFLLTESFTFRFGSFSVDPDGDIVFEHTIPARSLDRGELEASVNAVRSTANEYDDRIIREWGGVTAREKAMTAAKEAGIVP